MDAQRLYRWGVAAGRKCDPLRTNLSLHLLHLGALLQYALILDNERSLEGDATAEITDPL